MFSSIFDLTAKTQDSIDLSPSHIAVKNKATLEQSVIDELLYTAVFSSDEELKDYCRTLIVQLAQTLGAYSASMYPIYQAFGRGELSGFTIPAVNIRTLTYDTARLIFRLMMQKNIGAVVFEIARSEIEYTDQRPQEYSTVILAAAIKEGYRGPVFLQGDHYQFSKNKFTSDKDAEIERIKNLVQESINGHFSNIDIDASTLVDLDKKDVAEQQQNNYEMTALLTTYIRSIQPKDQTISIGGEIGHIGGRNSTTKDFEAFMTGYQRLIQEEGLGKISVQTGSSHGGTVLPDGTIQEVRIDFPVLKDIGEVARQKYHIGGAVQHGASTLPLSYFENFVAAQTLEVHLATGFQNIVYDTMPQNLKSEIYTWLKEQLSNEKEDGWNAEQFLYKTRKKAFGPFKQMLWDLTEEEKQPILHALEQQFLIIFDKLNIAQTKDRVNSYLPKHPVS